MLALAVIMDTDATPLVWSLLLSLGQLYSCLENMRLSLNFWHSISFITPMYEREGAAGFRPGTVSTDSYSHLLWEPVL